MNAEVCFDCGINLRDEIAVTVSTPPSSAIVRRVCRACWQKRADSGFTEPAGADSASTTAKEPAAMNPAYMSQKQVKDYVAAWLKHVSKLNESQPRQYMRMRALLKLPAPPKGDNHG